MSGELRSNDFTANGGAGLATLVTTNLTVASNQVSGNGIGIEEMDSLGLSVSMNRIERNAESGFEAYYTKDLLVSQNHIAQNGGVGITISLSWRLTIRENVVEDNGYAGIGLDSVAHVLIVANAIRDHAFGILVTGDIMPVRFISLNVTVHHNRLTNNTLQAWDVGSNRWDDGFPSGGNYWSDYGGVDNCTGPNQDVCPNPDGLGDTPYALDARHFDRYPLMGPGGAGRPPVALARVSSTNTVMGETLTFDGTESFDDYGVVAYAWDFGDGTTDTRAIATHAYTARGTFLATLTVWDAANQTDSASVSIAVQNRPPVASAGPDRTVPKAIVVLDGSASLDPDGDVLTFRWTQVAGPSVLLQSVEAPRPTFVPSLGGTYEFRLVVEDGIGGEDDDTVVVTVPNEGPVAWLLPTPPRASVGEVIRFEAAQSFDPDGAVVAYSFDFGDGEGIDQDAPFADHAYARPGTYVVTLTVFDAEELISRAQVPVVISLPTAEVGPPPMLWGIVVTGATILSAFVLLVVRRRRPRAPGDAK